MLTNILIPFTLLAILIGVPVLAYVVARFERVTVFEFQEGLKYRHGKLARVLKPGTYWVWPRSGHVVLMDMRPTVISCDGLQVLTRDGVLYSVSVTSKVQVTDSRTAFSSTDNYLQSANSMLQAVTRKVVNSGHSSEIGLERGRLQQTVMQGLSEDARGLGISYVSLEVTELSAAGKSQRPRAGFSAEPDGDVG